MSNWLDVRIKLYSDKSQIDSIREKFREYFYKTTRRDHNAAINLGSTESKFVWCAIKPFENFNSIVGNAKVGLNEPEAADICKWISSKFPDITEIDIQTRDDASRIFAVFRWSKNQSHILKSKKIDPLHYPDLGNDLDGYSDAASKKISIALRTYGVASVFGMNATKVEDAFEH